MPCKYLCCFVPTIHHLTIGHTYVISYDVCYLTFFLIFCISPKFISGKWFQFCQISPWKQVWVWVWTGFNPVNKKIPNIMKVLRGTSFSPWSGCCFSAKQCHFLWCLLSYIFFYFLYFSQIYIRKMVPVLSNHSL
jgi:hypothetical protein